jgi:predicted nucleotidyltransferase
MRAALPELVQILVERHGAREVWLFGSLSGGTPHERSDLDLAVRGVAPSGYFTALSEVQERAPVPVDLVTLEDAPQALATVIATTGAAAWLKRPSSCAW